MKRNQLIAALAALGITGVEGLSFAELQSKLAQAMRAKAASLVPTNTDPADVADEEERQYEEVVKQFFIANGITPSNDCAAQFDAIAEIVDAATPGATVSLLEVMYNNNKFKLAAERNESTRECVGKFIGFDVIGDRTAVNGNKYQQLLATVVIFDAKGNGTQMRFTLNSSLIASMERNNLFKGVKIENGVPVLKEGQVIYAVVKLSQTEAGVTTWGSNDADILEQAEKAKTLIYTVKGKRFAAVYDRTTSTQDSLDTIVGIVDPKTVARLEEGQLTEAEKHEALQTAELRANANSVGLVSTALLNNQKQIQDAVDFLVNTLGLSKESALAQILNKK